MTDEKSTTMTVKISTWRRLLERKEAPGQPFDEVINKLLDEADNDA